MNISFEEGMKKRSVENKPRKAHTAQQQVIECLHAFRGLIIRILEKHKLVW